MARKTTSTSAHVNGSSRSRRVAAGAEHGANPRAEGAASGGAAPAGSPRNGHARVRRPEPSRTRPIRSFAGLLGGGGGRAAAPAANGQAANGQAANGQSARAAVKPLASVLGGAASGTIDRAVGIGYQVIDEYMRQGQRVAEAMSRSLPGAGPGGWGAPGGNTANGAGFGGLRPGDLPALTERMFQYAQDFTSVWFDMMGVMMSGAAAAGVPGAAGPAPAPTPVPAAEPAVARPLALRVALASTRPAEVAVDWRGDPPTGPLDVGPLHGGAGGAARIRGTKVEVDGEGRLAITLSVPADVPAGNYQGTIVDVATSSPRGTITVSVAG